jgi:CheY-like chemotaxis protein
MLIAFLTNDLVFPSRVAAIAAKIGARMETAASESALLARLESVDSADTLVLLDLSTTGVDVAHLVAAIRTKSPCAIIAFGPHVHEAKLAAARAAGCNPVLSRGQFDAQISDILEQFAAH